MLRLSLLGTFQLERDGQPVRLPTRKVESLLAYLALHPGPHGREKLATLLWGDVPDEQARASLRNALPVLRKLLGDETLAVARDSVQLNPSGLWVDVLDLDTQATDLQTASVPNPTAFNPDLYRGDLLTDFFDAWIAPEREAARNTFVNACLRLCQQWRAQGEYTRAILVAEKILTIDPTIETAYQHLMATQLALGDKEAALNTYRRCEKCLREQLDVEPAAETVRLYEKARQSESPRSAQSALTNLPVPLTSFIGREREIGEVKNILAPSVARPVGRGAREDWEGVRLLTLTGPGGAGKTRLAIRVAGELAEVYADGVSWMELAALVDPALLPSTIVKVLGLRETPAEAIIETIINHLRPRRVLLVLDNCEHLILASAQLANQLLQACPQLQILCTSREVLGITGETVYPVPTFTVSDDLARSEAVRLFAARASAVKPMFGLTHQNIEIIAHICQRLDGSPLAIELAAARVKVLTVEQIAERLDDRFSLLTGGSRAALPRHQTLRAAIDWSYDLLDEDEQALFRQASAFVGGFVLEAIGAGMQGRTGASALFSSVPPGDAGSHAPLLDTVARLVDKSLLIAEEGRYRMLDTIREYAADKLWLAGEEAEAKARLLNWMVRFAEQAEPELQGAAQAKWFDRLEREQDNVRAALRYALESGGANIELGLRICGALWFFWGSRGYLTEARERVLSLLARPEVSARTAARAKALLAAGGLAIRQADYEAAQPLFAGSLAIYREVNEAANIALALHYCGWAENALGRFEAARAFYEESLSIRRGLGSAYQRQVADSLVNLGMLAFTQKEYETAWRFQEEGLAIQRAAGEPWNLGYSLYQLGVTATALGNFEQAQKLLSEGLEATQTLKDQIMLPYLLEAFACLAAATHQIERAAQLFGAAEAQRERVRAPIPPQWRAFCGRVTAELRSNDEATVTRGWAEGRAMSVEAAVVAALEGQ